MKLTVTEHLTYVFDIPDDQVAEVVADPDAWFCNQHNPAAEAESFWIDERDCELEIASPDEAALVQLKDWYVETSSAFQEEIETLAIHADLPVLTVYALWDKYAKACQASDQSAILPEFKQQHQAQLNPKETRP